MYNTSERHLSYSQLSAWLACKYRWHLMYPMGLRAEETVGQDAEVGSVVHASIEAWLRDGTSPDDVVGEWLEEQKLLNSMVESLSGEEMVIDDTDALYERALYVSRRAVEYLKGLGWETVEVNGQKALELELSAPVEGFQEYIGRLDWVARDPRNGQTWIVDFKTRKRFQDEGAEDTNLQHATYQYLLLAAGVETTGSVTLQINSYPPSVPKINRDGTVSRTKLMSDWPTYSEVVARAGFDPNDYLDMKSKLSYEFAHLTRSFRGTTEIENVWNHIVVPAAREMAESRGIYRSMSHFNCRFCSVKDHCLSALRGYADETVEYEDVAWEA